MDGCFKIEKCNNEFSGLSGDNLIRHFIQNFGLISKYTDESGKETCQYFIATKPFNQVIQPPVIIDDTGLDSCAYIFGGENQKANYTFPFSANVVNIEFCGLPKDFSCGLKITYSGAITNGNRVRVVYPEFGINGSRSISFADTNEPISSICVEGIVNPFKDQSGTIKCENLTAKPLNGVKINIEIQNT